MYLKRLEINGFKSFANKTILDFLPPKDGRFSITAVVGPNGSGKSNVTDAIRWVMGETSLKNIRGKKSEDVIFAGSESKGQLGMAEVIMVLDNSDKKISLDYPEIIITRRLYRSGESEYLINGNEARLLDIHLLFAQAQFAQHSYSIVGQGMIDKMLTVSPQERKDFLDEASGIKEFQIKQHQAKLKLARTEENVKSATVLINEIEPRLKLLSRQVKKLNRRQEVEMELREIQESYYTTIYNRHQTEIDDISKNLKAADENYRQTFTELESVQNTIAELARASSRQEIFNDLQVKYQSEVHEKHNLERQLAVIEGQMHAEFGKEGKGNIGWLENKIAELKNNQENSKHEIEKIESKLQKDEETILNLQKQADNLAAERTQKQVKIARLQTQLMDSESQKSFLEFSGLTAVSAIVKNKSRFGTVYGLVAELGQVDQEYQMALEVAAGNHLTSLVVKDEEVARLAINYLRENKLGVATFLPQDKIESRYPDQNLNELLNEDGVLGLATDLIKHQEKFANIFSLVLGNTLVVKDLRVAERLGLGRARMVTLDGDLVEKNKVMRGGFRQRKLRGLGFSGSTSLNEGERQGEYQTQINLERFELNELETKLENLKTNILENKFSKESSQAKLEVMSVEQTAAIKEIAALEQELALVKNPEDFTALLNGLNEKKNNLLKEIDTRIEAAEILSKEIQDFNQKEEEKKQRVFALQEKMQTLQLSVNQIIQVRNELKVQLARLETKQEDLAREVESDMGTTIAAVIERQPPVVDVNELENLSSKIQKLKYDLSLIGGIDEEVVKEYETTKERYDFLTGQIDDLTKAIKDLRSLIADLDEIMKKKRESAFKKIRKEFDRYFQILFDGGSAKLEEIYGYEVDEAKIAAEGLESGEGLPVNPEQPASELNGVLAEAENPEESKQKGKKILIGIDIVACPPGKKIKNLSALSGGERTLTSIAIICAILSCNPAPFVVLDEVEAALDEANSQRFAKIMDELSTKSQFIVITHNRVTMHYASALYGVVMRGDGISQLMSVKLEDVRVDKS